MTMLKAPSPALADKRILLVEDSFLIAMRLKQLVEGLGCVSLGPAPGVDEAMKLIETDGCDAAILDIDLGAETAEPIAERLEQIGVPFIFVTGFSSRAKLGTRFARARRLRKPLDPAVLRSVMVSEFSSR